MEEEKGGSEREERGGASGTFSRGSVATEHELIAVKESTSDKVYGRQNESRTKGEEKEAEKVGMAVDAGYTLTNAMVRFSSLIFLPFFFPY